MNISLKIFRSKLFALLWNNPFTNWILIVLHLDRLPQEVIDYANWSRRPYDENRSLQENVGFSHIQPIQKLIDEAHARLLEFARSHLRNKDAVLDVGSGTGLYLKTLEGQEFYLYGVDLNNTFLQKSQALLPKSHFFPGDYLHSFVSPKKFNLICSFSVMMYIEPSGLEFFFERLYEDLAPSGYIFIQYCHALNWFDLIYPDLTYIRYSPHRMEKLAAKKFEVIRHEHFYDGHKVDWYDSKHYYFPDGTNHRLDTIENSYLLVLRKK